MRTTLLLFGMWLAATTAVAGEYNTQLNIGDPAPKWVGLPGTDGKTHSLDDLRDKPYVVVAFTCNSCPYAVDYEDRLIEFTRKYAGEGGKVAVVAINVNLIEEDRLPAMKERAESKGFNFPYLFDESQEIARKYGAIRTPEFYLLDADRKVVYMGALDDSPDPTKVQTRYLENALAAVQNGKSPELAETPPVGCAIRFARRRAR